MVQLTKQELMDAINKDRGAAILPEQAAKNVISLFAEKLQLKQRRDLFKGPFQRPFRYELNTQLIVDKNDHIVLELPGWSAIQQLPNGIDLRDTMGELVTDLLNLFWTDYEPQRPH